MMNFVVIMNFHMNEEFSFKINNIHHIDEFQSKWWILIATNYYHNHGFSSNWWMFLINITMNIFLHHDAFWLLKLIFILIMNFHQMINHPHNYEFHHKDEILKTVMNFHCNDRCSSKLCISLNGTFTKWWIFIQWCMMIHQYYGF